MDSKRPEFGFPDVPVPDHIDPMTSHHKTGVHKCSNCKSSKANKYFTKEEAKKTPAKRICNICPEDGAVAKAPRSAKKGATAPVTKAPPKNL